MTNKYLLSMNTGAYFNVRDDMKGQDVNPILKASTDFAI